MASEILIHVHVLIAGAWLGVMLGDAVLVFRVLETASSKHSSVAFLRHLLGVLTLLIGLDLARREGFPPWTHASALLVLIMILLDAIMFRSSRRSGGDPTILRGMMGKVFPIWIILYILTFTLMITQPF